jgi:hypothetical protein
MEQQQAFSFDREKSIDERFQAFKEEHPDVLAMFRRFACELRAAGHQRAGAKLIWERLRWERMTSAHGSGVPALNNNFTSRLARWLIEEDPTFDGWFEMRRLKTSDVSDASNTFVAPGPQEELS